MKRFCQGAAGLYTVGVFAMAFFFDISISSAQTCNADYNLDGEVTIDELILAVNQALYGCPEGQPRILSGQTATGTVGIGQTNGYSFSLTKPGNVVVTAGGGSIRSGAVLCLEIRPTVPGGERRCVASGYYPTVIRDVELPAGDYVTLVGSDLYSINYSLSVQVLPPNGLICPASTPTPTS